MDPETVFRKIYKNKAAALPYHEAISNHEDLIKQYKRAVKTTQEKLEAAAFEGIEPMETIDYMGAVRMAIRDNDPQAIKAAGLAAYQNGHYSAMKLAAEFDQDLTALIDHLQTYGELATANQRIFLRFALSPPEPPI